MDVCQSVMTIFRNVMGVMRDVVESVMTDVRNVSGILECVSDIAGTTASSWRGRLTTSIIWNAAPERQAIFVESYG